MLLETQKLERKFKEDVHVDGRGGEWLCWCLAFRSPTGDYDVNSAHRPTTGAHPPQGARQSVGNLEQFIQDEIGVHEDAVLVYLSDGTRLRTDNLAELAGAQDQTIFVFNKFYIEYELDDVLHDLRVEPPLQPPIEEELSTTPPYRPSALSTTYLRTAHTHLAALQALVNSLHVQHQSLLLSSRALDLHVLNTSDTFDALSATLMPLLSQQQKLLQGVDGDLGLVARVQVHPEFLSANVRRAIEHGEIAKMRTLGDYVSDAKMRQVAETCRKTNGDLQAKFRQAQQAMAQLSEGTDEVRDIVSNASHLDDAEASLRRAQELYDQISDAAASLESPAADTEGLLRELRQLDSALRSEVIFVTSAKNSYTQQCISALRRISALNADLVQLPPLLSSLQASYRAKNSFSHISRLHNMLYVYGATVVEIVRRKEFARFFYGRAQNVLEVMAKLSASEKKRRQVYRSDIHGQLPFDPRGMDEPVPTIDFSTSRGNLDDSSGYTLERKDVDELMRFMNELEGFAHTLDPVAVETVKEAKFGLEKLIAKMDGLEASFDRLAERSLLSSSRLMSSRRRINGADEQAYQELADQLREAQQAKAALEASSSQERARLQAEITQLRANAEELNTSVNTERERSDRLERDLHLARAQIEGDTKARKVLESRHAELLAEVDSMRRSHAEALAEATEQTKAAEVLRQELDQVRAEAEAVKALETRNSDRIARLVVDQATTLRNLEEARARGEDLESQIKAARADSDQVHRALDDARREKDRLLRAQASEHDRIMRDHMVEADSDRAVLQHHFSELKATLEDKTRELKDMKTEIEIQKADATGLREELQRVELELRESRHVERILREELRSGEYSHSEIEHREEQSNRLVAEILAVAIAFRNAQVKAMNAAQAMTAHPSAASKASSNLTDSVFHSSPGPSVSPLSAGFRRNLIMQQDEPEPIDPSDPAAALEVLRSFDQDLFLEAIAKTGSTIRKWQKQCKEYRERAKGKISFRNFAKGDLALFLPTRNSVSKPWAAFNVSFPHYFLQANGHLAEQLKTREWIVARITSITERIVDGNDPDSNPYGLGDGVKYYMLEVEDWTQPTPSGKRKVSSRQVSTTDREPPASPPADVISPPPGPPEAEVEESFGVTRAPASHLFPVRQRASSSPTAGPSALSRLLAQAPAENGLEPIPATPPSAGTRPSSPGASPSPAPEPEPSARPLTRSPSPATSPPPPPSPIVTRNTPPAAVSGSTSTPHLPSPLRPGSRASRNSTSSRFSVRIPPFGGATVSGSAAKASPTTALAIAEHPISPSQTMPAANDIQSSPSPDESIFEGMSNQLMQHDRRRTTSYHIPRPSPLTGSPSISNARGTITFANLANSWGFGRKKRLPVAALKPAVADAPTDTTSTETGPAGRAATATASNIPATSAADLLKKF
ncbi:hypothetical protein PUNSTDRAFT_143929 [Punctularia strigosozonata HHB-11173 SS5]|uniref:uncharacterized protein n=1 Tax=Punctularia strigosozonata (strain HHB-11173) TaxID=741275 RepID=UPI00044164D1|nr:uncharacterized protein PUNSTDRAFT_143929 [Punctularia strigosozonata HHB-11173 SS5]EIN08294.1 hypothetical protein PUNSTDRAFT_143929 [Punctularia strigosozonata HHB-11173 SS5]